MPVVVAVVVAVKERIVAVRIALVKRIVLATVVLIIQNPRPATRGIIWKFIGQSREFLDMSKCQYWY